eukprot:CCRYP_015066-RA/>CCRYP_015066-RA protein AED:0.22 eAED:0.64 QI:0/0/0/1/0.5/0.33/3/0/304
MSLIYTHPTSRNNLYLGGKDDAKSLSKLQQRNVRRVLNVTPAKVAGITAGIQYKRIPVYDASTSDMLSYAEEIVNFISNGLHHGSVLVHCQRGVSRSATAVIMFLIRKANMTYEQSLQLCQKRRRVVDPIPAFCEQLKEYEKDCREWGYLTAVNQEENAKNGLVKGAGFENVASQASSNTFTGEKRKLDASGGASCRNDHKRGTLVGAAPPPPQVPFLATCSVNPKVICPSVGPYDRKSSTAISESNLNVETSDNETPPNTEVNLHGSVVVQEPVDMCNKESPGDAELPKRKSSIIGPSMHQSS